MWCYLHLFPTDPLAPKPDWPKLRDQLLERQFIVLPRGASEDDRFDPGPLYRDFCDQPFDGTEIAYEDHGDQMQVYCGPDTEAPTIPGTNRTIDEDYLDFIGRWAEDPKSVWTDPETGKSYGLLDLDWKEKLAAGTFVLTITQPGLVDAKKCIALLQELTGRAFRYAYVWL